MAGPTIGLDKEDDDEACEIGSDESGDEEEEGDDDVDKTQNSKAAE